MFKNIPLLFYLIFLLEACTHKNLEDHFQESKTGWTKQQIFKRFGSPDESYEDSTFKYYIYKILKPSNSNPKKDIEWQVRYVFEQNKVVDVIEERVATSDELDKLETSKIK